MSNDGQPNWGPSGRVVFERTYSRPMGDGKNETWLDTCNRVAQGNIALAYGNNPGDWSEKVVDEFFQLRDHMFDFRILPGGRHLWATGVEGRQFLMNCWTSGWDAQRPTKHFTFMFMRLMEHGGVGANYSTRYSAYDFAGSSNAEVAFVCDETHPDYQDMLQDGLLDMHLDRFESGAVRVKDTREGWAHALHLVLESAFGIGPSYRVFNLSDVRSSGSPLVSSGGTASGPKPLAVMLRDVTKILAGKHRLSPLVAMELDHAIAQCVMAGGSRRSARMSILHWMNGEIWDFIKCKEDPAHHWTTNISVEIDNQFLSALKNTSHSLHSRANAVFERVVDGMLMNGEPGFWNSSLSSVGERGPIYATNPCGEIALEPWEACNLGHVNLGAFATDDLSAIITAHGLVTRMLIRATMADVTDEDSQEVVQRNRRIGVGHTGVQAYLARAGYKLSELRDNPEILPLELMQAVVRVTAHLYANELGIPTPNKTTTVAPTGSVSKLAGVPEAIQPIYARYFEQRVRFSLVHPEQAATVKEARAQGLTVELDQYDQSGNTAVIVYPTENSLVHEVLIHGGDPSLVETPEDLSVAQMLSIQAAYQERWADNAVSFTVNVHPDADRSEVVEALKDALPHLKGTTLMVDNSRPQAPFTRITREQYEASQAQSVGDSIDLDCATGACPIK